MTEASDTRRTPSDTRPPDPWGRPPDLWMEGCRYGERHAGKLFLIGVIVGTAIGAAIAWMI